MLNKYIYVILCSHVKQCKNVTFSGGEACVLKFQNVFGVGSIKVTGCRKKNLEKFVLWDAVELINLINMNHKKYPRSCKSLDQKW